LKKVEVSSSFESDSKVNTNDKLKSPIFETEKEKMEKNNAPDERDIILKLLANGLAPTTMFENDKDAKEHALKMIANMFKI